MADKAEVQKAWQTDPMLRAIHIMIIQMIAQWDGLDTIAFSESVFEALVEFDTARKQQVEYLQKQVTECRMNHITPTFVVVDRA